MALLKALIYTILTIILLLCFLWFKPLPSFHHDSPRSLPWSLPDYKTAKTSIEILADGRIKITIAHLPLINIEPKMVACFYKVLPISTIDIKGETYPLYHIFHPTEHGVITVQEAATDGSLGMGVGALVARQEWFGQFNSKGAGRIIKFSDQEMVITPEKFGLHFGKITHNFNQTNVGTQYNVESIIGSELPIIGSLINYYIRHKMFTSPMLEQWVRHQVEEVSSLQFFLNDLYHSQAIPENVNNTQLNEEHYQFKLAPSSTDIKGIN